MKASKLHLTLLHSTYMTAMVLYMCCWVVALGGLSALQKTCADHEMEFGALAASSGMLAPAVGSDCKKLFRFPWTILWLGFIPVLAEVLAFAKWEVDNNAKVTVGAGSPLWAVIAVLDIIMANLFFNAVQANDIMSDFGGFSSTAMRRLKCTLAGFAMSAALALLLICMAPYCAATEDHDTGMGSTTTAQSDKRATKGGVVPPAPVQADTGTPAQVVVA